ncbi:MAG TPA: EthD family reductase [Candidatus Limnocylindrales bacterium]|nr:EthD family reductase [Candidatus Limnocylindrales bacterium]
MPATLAAMYKRPEGGDEALTNFWQRYHDEHLPLIAKLPGLRGTKVWNVTRKYAGEDLVAVCFMEFDDNDALKAAMKSDEMGAAGANLAEIAPDLLTLVALEESWQ